MKGWRGWEGLLASLTQWTWVWASSRRWWRTGKVGGLQSMWSWVRHDWVTEQQQPICLKWGHKHPWIHRSRQDSDSTVRISLESFHHLMDCKEIKPVHHKGDQSWVFIGRTDVEAETAILWTPDVKNWLTWKDPDAQKDWGQEEKGMTKDEMIGWHHQLNGYEFW